MPHFFKIKTNLKQKIAGFTLVETVVTATIFAVIAVGIGGSFFSGMKLWSKAKTMSMYYNNVLFDLEKFTREIRSSFLIPQIGYLGEEREVSFPLVKNDTVIRVTYRFDKEEKKLYRKEELLEDIIEKNNKFSEELFAVLDDVSFSYFFVQETKFVWAGAWKNPGSFYAIKIKIKFKDEEITKTIFIPASY